MNFIFEGDLGPSPLQGSLVAVIGFGNQGRAQAENLRDSGIDTVVGLRPGSWLRGEAETAGFRTVDIGEAAHRADIIALLVPDEVQGEVYGEHIAPAMGENKALLFAHGFAVHFGQIVPPPSVDVIMVAPKGPGHQVRHAYLDGSGVVMLAAVHQDPSGEARDKALAYACAIGGGRAGIFESTFREECETDLFGEQAVICGGLSHLITAGFETLVDAGYEPEMAYFECLHEVKLVADLIHQRGIAGMRRAISGTACFGDLTRGSRVIGPAVREEMRKILDEVRSGAFAREWLSEHRAGHPRQRKLLEESGRHPIESTGANLRRTVAEGAAEKGRG